MCCLVSDSTSECEQNRLANFALDFSRANLQGIHETTNQVDHGIYEPDTADNNTAARSNLNTSCTEMISYPRIVHTSTIEYDFAHCQDPSIYMTYSGVPKISETRTCPIPALVPLTSLAAEHMAPPIDHTVTNTCNIAMGVHRTNKTLEPYQPLSTIDAHSERVASGTAEDRQCPVEVDAGSTRSARAPVNSPGSNLNYVNRSTPQEGTPKRRSKQWSCDKCEKKFTSSSGLSTHAVVHSGKRPHSCPCCGKRFNRHGNMVRHQRAHSGVKPFRCLVCGKAFGQKVLLVRHHVTHTGDRPFSCDICGQTFSWKTSLTPHRLTHSRRKPHTCTVCDRAFRMAYGLRRHMTMHTGERSYMCDVCGLAFSQSSNLASHRKTHTNVRPHRCSDCGSSFVRKYHLRRHLLIHKRNQDESPVCKDTTCNGSPFVCDTVTYNR